MNEEVKEEIEALMSIYEDDMEGKTKSLNISTFYSTCKIQIQFSVLEESPNYLISMNVRSMNESEDVPTVFLRISYPDGYPDKPLDIEYDDEENDSYEAEDLSELDGVLKNVVSRNICLNEF